MRERISTTTNLFFKRKDFNLVSLFKSLENLDLTKSYKLEVYVLNINYLPEPECYDPDLDSNLIRIDKGEFYFDGDIKVFLEIFYHLFDSVVEDNYYLCKDDGLVCHNIFIVRVIK